MSLGWIWWALGFLGLGGIVAVAVFWSVLPANLRLWLIAAGAAVLGVAGIYARGEAAGERKAEAKQKKENDDFKDKVKRNDEVLRNLSDDDLGKRLRSKDGKPRVG